MPRPFASPTAPRALPPRAEAFCRAAMTVVAAIMSISALILLISVVVALRTAKPGFGQELAEAAEGPVPAGDGAIAVSGLAVWGTGTPVIPQSQRRLT